MESLSFLAALCLDPLRFVGKEAIFYIDNVATVLALTRGHAKDRLTTVIIRASRVVGTGLGCQLSARGIRRSSQSAIIEDNLAHNIKENLSDDELLTLLDLNQVSFLPPLLEWMSNPGQDQELGRRCLIWLRDEFPILKVLWPDVEM